MSIFHVRPRISLPCVAAVTNPLDWSDRETLGIPRAPPSTLGLPSPPSNVSEPTGVSAAHTWGRHHSLPCFFSLHLPSCDPSSSRPQRPYLQVTSHPFTLFPPSLHCVPHSSGQVLPPSNPSAILWDGTLGPCRLPRPHSCPSLPERPPSHPLQLTQGLCTSSSHHSKGFSPLSSLPPPTSVSPPRCLLPLLFLNWAVSFP